jgi:hypothetical protein
MAAIHGEGISSYVRHFSTTVAKLSRGGKPYFPEASVILGWTSTNEALYKQKCTDGVSVKLLQSVQRRETGGFLNTKASRLRTEW